MVGAQVAVLLGVGDGEGEGVKVAVGSLVLVAVSGIAVMRATGDPDVQADTNKKMAAINRKWEKRINFSPAIYCIRMLTNRKITRANELARS